MSKTITADVTDGETVEAEDTPAAEALSVVDGPLIDDLVARARQRGLDLTGPEGLLTALTKRVLESALEGELTDHLGYDKHDPMGRGSGNSRNGTRAKTVLTDIGPVEIEVPRDREGSFDPQIVAKRQRRLAGVEDMVLSLSAKGLTHGEISAHLAEVYGASVSKTTISTITEKVMDGMAECFPHRCAAGGAPGRVLWMRSTPWSSSTRSCAARRCVTEWRWKTCTVWSSQRLG